MLPIRLLHRVSLLSCNNRGFGVFWGKFGQTYFRKRPESELANAAGAIHQNEMLYKTFTVLFQSRGWQRSVLQQIGMKKCKFGINFAHVGAGCAANNHH